MAGYIARFRFTKGIQMKVTKMRFKVGHQNPLSEPTLTSERFDLKLFGDWFRVAAKNPNNKPVTPFRVHLSCVDFITIDESAEGIESDVEKIKIYNPLVIKEDRGTFAKVGGLEKYNDYKDKSVGDMCLTEGCSRPARHRGRHVVSKQGESAA